MLGELICQLKKTEGKRIIQNILWSFIFKGMSLVISLVCTRQYILYFSNDAVLGVWYAIVSILNWIINFDLGIGNGIRNHIVVPLERSDHLSAKTIISTGYAVVGGIAIVLVGLGALASFLVNWNVLLNISPDVLKRMTLIEVTIISFVGVGIQFFLKVVISIYQAQRKTLVSGLTALLSNVMIYQYLGMSSPENSTSALIQFAIVHVCATNIPLIIVTVWAFSTSLREERPSLKFFDWQTARRITSLGINFFVIQLALMLVSSTDSWLITFLYSPDDVVLYQIYYRFFSIALTIFALFSQTMWSAVTKYIAERKSEEIKRISIFLYAIAALGSGGCIVVALNFRHIVNIWMDDIYVKITTGCAILFALWFSIQMFVNASTAVANGSGHLKCQNIFVPIAAIIKIACAFLFAHMGLPWYGIIYGNILCLLPLALMQQFENGKYIKSLN